MHLNELIKQLSKLQTWPWRALATALVSSFMLATVVSLSVSKVLMPEFSLARPGASLAVSQMRDFGRGSQATLSGQDISIVLERNLFNREGALGDASTSIGERQMTPSDEVLETNLPIKVLGIIYGGTPFSGLATIENKDKRLVNSFVVGDIVIDGAEVVEIHHDRIYLQRNGRKEYAMLEEFKLIRSSRGKTATASAGRPGFSPLANGPPPAKFSEPGFSRDGAKVLMTEEYKLMILGRDFQKTLQDAKASPNMVDGELRGFVLTRIREDSIYQKAGFQNGDVVEEINGMPLTDAAGAISTLQSLRNEPNISVRVKRGGKLMTLDLTVN